MEFIKSLAEHIEHNGAGVRGNTLFVYSRPPLPEECVTLYNSGGLPETGDTTQTRSVQIIGRSEDYDTAYSLVENIHNLIKQKFNYWIFNSQIWVFKSEAQGQINTIGKEGEGEKLFLVGNNYSFWIKDYS